LASIAAHAGFSAKPPIVTMNVSRGEYNGWAEIAHTSGNLPHAVELTVKERILDLDGNIVKDTIAPAKDFIIHPANILLAPGKTVKVQIVYKGPKIEADKVYTLHVKEIALPEGQKEQAITMGLAVRVNYNVGILMNTGKPPSMAFVSSKALDSGKVEVIMENKGKGKFLLENINLYANNSKALEFKAKVNSVMPGQQRRFVFDYHKPLTAKEVYFGK
jgi:P pilus assembly chaperone PapD